MRKTIFADLLPAINDSPLSNFHNHRIATQWSDARENPSGHAFKVGAPSGTIYVPGKRGWIYAQRVWPDSSTTVQVYVPTDAKGKTRVKFKAGTAIIPTRTGDTNPTYWTYSGIPPATKTTASNDCIGFYYAGGAFGEAAGTYYGPTCGACGVTNRIYGGTGPGYDPRATSGEDYYDPSGPSGYISGGPIGVADNTDEGFEFGDPTTVPSTSDSPPLNPLDNQLWYDGTYTRRFHTMRGSGDITQDHWDIVTGPTAGTFIEVVAGEALTAGDIVYKTQGVGSTYRSKVMIADRTTLAGVGHVLGLCHRTSPMDRITVLQTSGIYYLSNSYDPGSTLYLGASGALTTSIPATGTGAFVQKIGTVINQYTILIDLGPAIKRV